MQGSFIFFVVVFIITITAFGGLVFHSLQAVDPVEVPEIVRLGKQVWQENACVECHTILGHGGYFGPDLTNVWTKHGSDWLRDFLQDPPTLPTATKKRHMGLDQDEADLVIQFLKFVEEIKKTEGWPPKPLFFTLEGR